ncbi:MAG: L,D-transpeptidase [Phycisphaerae bacterium]|nr:L,D-transpeptidase [Phycisphaerae bacterium]
MRRCETIILACVWPLFAGCHPDSKPHEAEQSVVVGGALPERDWHRLQSAGWAERAGNGLGLWVSVARQRLFGIEHGLVRFGYACSTAAKGTGNLTGSNKTPLGWHEVQERYGEGLPPGAVFKERKYTEEIWSPGEPAQKDLILSRIMWLRGLEPGVNAGPGVDSHARYIYIHGTAAEDRLGAPASMGCVRLANEDVIRLFDQTRSGTPVLITEW